MMLNNKFYWWMVVEGVALCIPDTKHFSMMIDAGKVNVYATIEGAIIHGGVIATAFERSTEETYDAAAFIKSGAMIPTGAVTITKITAERGA